MQFTFHPLRLLSGVVLSIALMPGFAVAQDATAEAPKAEATASAPDLSETLDQRRDFETGEEAFNKVCGRCHVTGVGPDLSEGEYDLDSVTHFVRNGYLAMPAFPQSSIDDATLAEIATYITDNLKKGEAQ